MKTIYIFNCNNKNEYICTKTVQDNINIQKYATDIPYPETQIGYTRCFDFNTNSWSQPIQDNRGITIYKKDNSLVKTIHGDIGEIPNDWTKISPAKIGLYKFNDNIQAWEQLILNKIIKQYSKLSIIRQLKKISLWNQIKQIMIDNDVIDEWDSAQFLAEDDQLFISIKNILAEKYTDINIQQLLSKCYY